MVSANAGIPARHTAFRGHTKERADADPPEYNAGCATS